MSVSYALVGAWLLGVPPLATAATDDYTLQTWTQADGLPGARVWAITQDDDGYIWIGTDAGLVRFDGVDFVDWERLSEAPLPKREVTALCASRDGDLWVGFGIHGGIARVRGDEVDLYGDQEGLSSGFVTFITEDEAGTLWSGGLGGLHRFDGTRWEHIGASGGVPDGPTFKAYQDNDGNLWVAYTTGMFRRLDTQTFELDPAPAILNTTPADAIIKASSLEAVQPNSSFTLMTDQRGQAWLATLGQGLWIARPRSDTSPGVDHVTVEAGLSSDFVQTVFEDRDGNIWVGTQAGLHQFSTRSVRPVRHLGFARALEATSDGSVWAGTHDGVVRLHSDEEQRFGRDDGVPNSAVTALHGDAEGNLWIATLAGMVRYREGRFRRLEFPQDTSLSWVSALTTDANGNLWIGDMYNGVLRWSAGRLTPFKPLPAELRSAVYSIYTDGAGHVWVGFTNGKVGVIRPDLSFQLHETVPGLDGTVTAFYADRDGALWIGASDGLSRLKAGRFVTATNSQNGVPLDTVTTVAEDDRGHLWVGTSSGIISVRSDQFDQIAEDPAHQVEYALFDSFDGLDSMPVRIGTPAGTRRADGTLWFVTGAGAVVIDPRRLSEAAAPPRVRVEEIRADGERLVPNTPLTLPVNVSRLQIGYTALTYTSPTRIRFRYRLEGFDNEWVDAGTRREATYTNLPPNTYQFRVIARSNRGGWNDDGAGLTFSIPPPFYRTTWFLTICTLAVGLSVFGAWRLRMRQVHRQYSLVWAERARLSREIHDTLLQSLVGVALQFDALAGRLGEGSDTTRQHLRRMRRDVEDHIREARESIRNLRSRPGTRSLTVALREECEHLTADTSVDLAFEVTGKQRRCSAVVEAQIMRIAREAVTNVLRHAEARRVSVALQYGDTSLMLRVADDGRGFDPDQVSHDDPAHLGLTSMRERAAEVGGTLEVSSQAGAGTQVQIVVPTQSGTEPSRT